MFNLHGSEILWEEIPSKKPVKSERGLWSNGSLNLRFQKEFDSMKAMAPLQNTNKMNNLRSLLETTIIMEVNYSIDSWSWKLECPDIYNQLEIGAVYILQVFALH